MEQLIVDVGDIFIMINLKEHLRPCNSDGNYSRASYTMKESQGGECTLTLFAEPREDKKNRICAKTS